MNVSNRERGAVMVWALIFVIVTAGMVISHSAYMASHRQTMDVHLKRKPLASTFARAALTDGLSWFQGQSAQPVTEFAPRRDLSVNPPILDTHDPALGLVREFEIRGNLWGRYELRKEDATDMSSLYGNSAPGSVWDLAARGYVYRVLDPSKPFDVAPNKVVSTTRVETTIRSVPLNLPASAAVAIDDLAALTVGPGGRIRGGSSAPGVAAPPPALAWLLGAVLAIVAGTPGVLTVPTYDSQPTTLFRMTLPELRDVSDLSVVAGFTRWLSQPVADHAIVYHHGDLTIPPERPLRGSMLLVVDGNLTVQAGSDTRLRGVVVVTGNTELRGPFVLEGVLVAKGNLLVQGNGAGQDAVVEYDAAAVQRVIGSMSRYRGSRIVRSRDAIVSKPASNTAASMGSGTIVSSTAEIEPNVTLGTNVQVQNYVRIETGSTVGNSTILRASARVGEYVQVGANVQIGTGSRVDELAFIGDGAVIGNDVRIEPGARIAPGATVPDNATVRAGTSFP